MRLVRPKKKPERAGQSLGKDGRWAGEKEVQSGQGPIGGKEEVREGQGRVYSYQRGMP